jgi:hypothetical protein
MNDAPCKRGSANGGNRKIQINYTQQFKRKVIAAIRDNLKNVGDEEGKNKSKLTAAITKVLDESNSDFDKEHSNINCRRKINRWWGCRDTIMNSARMFSGGFGTGKSRCLAKTAVAGRGRKTSPWAEWLHKELYEDFGLLGSYFAQVSNPLLFVRAKTIVTSSKHVLFNSSYIVPAMKYKGGKVGERNLRDVITQGFISNFIRKYDLVRFLDCEKLPQWKAESTERYISFHLGEIKRKFDSGTWHPGQIETVQHVHFTCDAMPLSASFEKWKSERVHELVEKVGGDGSYTVSLVMAGGVVKSVFVVFRDSSHRGGGGGNINGIRYQTHRKGWMDQDKFREWLAEDSANPHGTQESPRVLFLESHPGWDMADGEVQEICRHKHIQLHWLQAGSASRLQPSPTLLLSQFKALYCDQVERWRIVRGARRERARDSNSRSDLDSDSLVSPGRQWVVEALAKCREILNSRKVEAPCASASESGSSRSTSLVRHAMVLCGLEPERDGRWKVSQLQSDLREIALKYPEHFEGGLPPPEQVWPSAESPFEEQEEEKEKEKEKEGGGCRGGGAVPAAEAAAGSDWAMEDREGRECILAAATPMAEEGEGEGKSVIVLSDKSGGECEVTTRQLRT